MKNYQFLENQKYIELYRLLHETEKMLKTELSEIDASKIDTPQVSNVIIQHDNIVAVKGVLFSIMLRNGFHCDEKEDTYEIVLANNEIFTVNKNLLKNVLQGNFKEVITVGLAPERMSGGYSLSDKMKEQIRQEYTDRIKVSLENQLKDSLRKELIEPVKEDLKLENRKQVLLELKAELKDEALRQLKEKLADTVKAELRADLKDVIRHEMKTDLKTDVKHEIKKEIEKEVRQENTERIQEDINKEIQQKTNRGFYKDEVNDDIIIQQHQNVFGDFTIDIEENGIMKRTDIKIFPMQLPGVGRKLCKIFAVINNKATISPTGENGISFAIGTGEYGEQTLEQPVTITCTANWTDKIFIPKLYVQNNPGKYQIKQQKNVIQPETFVEKDYQKEFLVEKDCNGHLFSAYIYPLQNENCETGYTPFVARMIYGTAEQVVLSDTGFLNFGLGNNNEENSITGKFNEKGIFESHID